MHEMQTIVLQSVHQSVCPTAQLTGMCSACGAFTAVFAKLLCFLVIITSKREK